MNQCIKRSLAGLMVLVMCFSFLPMIKLKVGAETATNNTVAYKYAGNYVYNWGEREELATFLSPMAVSFYEENGVSYDELSEYIGGTSQDDASSSDLYEALQDLMKNTHEYETSYQETRPLYKYTDCQNSGNVISSFYSGKEIGPEWDSGATWNREHTWPNSKGLNGNDENDIMMLRPTSVSENSSRGNKAYGKSSSYYNPNKASGGSHDVRGDVARIFLYIYVRWENTSMAWGTAGVMESSEVLLEWMEADPVDTWELGRNDSVQAITGTRNVFVDYPELAFLLFGEEIPSDMDTPSGMAKVSAPSNIECSHVYDYYCDNVCNKCGEVRDTNHIFVGWEIILEATVDAPGIERGSCIYCHAETEREIPKLDSSDENEPNNPPQGDEPNEEGNGEQKFPTSKLYNMIIQICMELYEMILSYLGFSL
ncbi:MAG: endonuclease [Clostridia bacterium]|nr:endonuclease [Clostridia bacterium]